jgi:HlyD family secretion protein
MSGSATKGSAVPPRATSSGSLTSSSLGSTGNSLQGTGGTGGGGGGFGSSDFMMVLMKCIPGGSRVKAGDPVAEFDRQYQLNRLDDYKASLVQHEANIKKLGADQAVARQVHDQSIKTAFGNWEKANVDLQTVSVRSAIEVEELQLAEREMAAAYKEVRGEGKDFTESQRAALRNSELDRDQSKIELQRAQNNVDRMVMKAPIEGIVVMQTIFRGGDFGQVQQGDQIYPGQVFMTIVDPSSMVLNATVNQADSESLRVGMKAVVHLDAYPELALEATVAAVGAMTNSGGWRASWVREVPIRLKLQQKHARVIPDLSGSADIELATAKQAALAPLESIFRDAPDGPPYAWVQTPAGFERREVELGLASNIAVAVRSGLRPGEVVALARPPQAAGQRPSN